MMAARVFVDTNIPQLVTYNTADFNRFAGLIEVVSTL